MAHDAEGGRQRERGDGQEQDLGFHLSTLATNPHCFTGGLVELFLDPA
jgi:hypothetical protein